VTSRATATGRRAGPSTPVDIGLVAVAVALMALGLFGTSHLQPYNTPQLDPRPVLLPVYLLLSLLRLAVAYLVAVLLALAVGHLAARSRFARKLILPVLDVLQSVPILGFFPVAVGFFIAVFGGSALGVELAAVFLIFTSMFWNLAFGVYESLITLPEELGLAADQLKLPGPMRWSRLVLPAVMPTLLYNSLISWANGWYFLIASEIIAVGPARYTLPGLGSYLAQAVTLGRNDQVVLALLVLAATTVTMHLLIWGPFDTWAERFHIEETGDRPRTPRLARVLARSRIVRWFTRTVAIPAGQQSLALVARALGVFGGAGRWFAALCGAGLLAALGLLAARLWRLFTERPLSPDLRDIPLDLLLTFLRVSAALVISAAVSVLVARPIARHPHARGPAVAVIQILASIPAIAFFPLVVVLLAWGMGLNGAAVLLALTTMLWYVLFNVMGAAASIPQEMHEAAHSLGVTGMRHLRRIFVPAVLPGLVTGGVTAWGAGWNAMILCEFIEAGREVHSVRGIGATLDRATYTTGDMQVVAASLASMVLLIVLVNRFVWDPLYQRVAARYKMEA
jgi:NitT/TauT family transport system permease protein